MMPRTAAISRAPNLDGNASGSPGLLKGLLERINVSMVLVTPNVTGILP
jgi:hypothetical protein